jgi:tRNA-specific 2-thiouridylase
VSRIDPEKAEVVLSTDSSTLLRRECVIDEVNWLDPSASALPFSGSAQIRYGHRAEAAEILPLPEGRVKITFEKAVRAVTPGQAAVVYRDDRVVCGGWITSE